MKMFTRLLRHPGAVFLALVGLLTLFIGATRALPLNPHSVQYRIDQVDLPRSNAHSDCASVTLSSMIVTTPGILKDLYNGSLNAYLTQMTVTGGDNYNSYYSSGACSSTCPVNGSNLGITFGNKCVNIVTLSTGCRQYSDTGMSFRVTQSVYCNGIRNRTVTVTGKFYYDGCSNTGYIEFTLPAFVGVRGAVTYHICLVGHPFGHVVGTIPCGSINPVSPVPTSTLNPSAE